MMQPTLFIASSVEQLSVAHALQENLERDAEVTVWTQGVFELSKSTLERLTEVLPDFDFAVFVFAPDDITRIRNVEYRTIRDNVVFELGLFVGSIGRSRTFLIAPRLEQNLHFPSDLLGMTPGTYEPDRQDGNLVASLGPAANQIRRAIRAHGIRKDKARECEADATPLPSVLDLDDNDCISILESWMGSRPRHLNTSALMYSEVDAELKLPSGSTEKFIVAAAKRWGYATSRKGKQTILFCESSEPDENPFDW